METQRSETAFVALVRGVIHKTATRVRIWVGGRTPWHESPKWIARIVERRRLARAPALERVAESLLRGPVCLRRKVRIGAARPVEHESEIRIGFE